MRKTCLKFHLRELEHDISCSVLDLGKSKVVLGNSPDRRIVEPDKISQHCTCLIEWAVSVVFAHTVLLQEVILQHSSYFQRDLVIFSEGALPNELDDFREIFLLLEYFLCLHPQFHKARLGAFVIWLQNFGILGVRKRPIHRREMFPLCEFLV